MSKTKVDEIREQCEADLWTFACTMFPEREYGEVHKELCHFFQHEDSSRLLALVPREHQKSHIMAVYCAWKLTVVPWWTILYVSANPSLGEEQLGFIVDTFKREQHKRLWPNHLNWVKKRGGDLEHQATGRWRNDLIELDHPARKERGIRDPSIRTAGVGKSITGFHVDEIVFDDLVTDENYQSEAARRDVFRCYKNCAKIATTDSVMKAVGTRYGDADIYDTWLDIQVPMYKDGEDTGELRNLWSVFEKPVEDSPNRTGDGNFLWPRSYSTKLKQWFGFDPQVLATKKAELVSDGDIAGFLSQFYNAPNDASMQRINRSVFQYLDKKFLKHINGSWYYGDKQLRLTAAADLAFTEGTAINRRKRDFTALVVIGRDSDGYLYVLELDQFQTDKLEVYYERILELQDKWQFREIYVETNNGGKIVKADLQDRIRRTGGSLVVHGVAHTSHQGTKEERILQAVEPRYRNQEVFHFRGGYTSALEEQLMLPRPKNDDLKDVLALAIEKSKPVLGKGLRSSSHNNNIVQLSRFGGVRRRA